MLVVEDGPTLTHGGMKFGSGVVAAQVFGAKEIVNPRPWATGTIAETLRSYDAGPVLRAMGYAAEQLAQLRALIETVDAYVVVVGTPIDLRRLIDIRKPAVRVGMNWRCDPFPRRCRKCSSRP